MHMFIPESLFFSYLNLLVIIFREKKFLLSHKLPDIVNVMVGFNNEYLNTARIHTLVN